MEKFFEKRLTHNRISFCHTDKSAIDEREIHAYHEILFCIGEEILLRTEKFSRNVARNTLVIIPKGEYHYFDNELAPSFERLKINFSDTGEIGDVNGIFNDIRIIEEPSEEMLFAVKRIISALDNGKNIMEKYAAYGAFVLLLAEVGKLREENVKTTVNNSKVISECLEFINENLGKSISIENVSKKLNVSKSSITHNFKKEMGISVHRYIRQKRMFLAKKLIEEGHKPTKICFDCGYSEYSAFYKAYSKMFGCPPVRKKARD